MATKFCILPWFEMRLQIIHAIHCASYPAFLLFSYYLVTIPNGKTEETPVEFFEEFGIVLGFILILMRSLLLLAAPRVLINIFGLLRYNCYVNDVELKGLPLFAPFLCFRVVTKGNYPNLVKRNIERNIKTCLKVGVEAFTMEVVTDKPLDNLPSNIYIRQTVVPATYRPSHGAKYKARALQFCLEDGINQLNDQDWIVHLDEETQLTENSVRGILNFVMDGHYPFGQGLITFDHGIVNPITTLLDAPRVADDLGALRGQFKLFHKPLFGWKGSYGVCRVQAEKHVSYDHGLAGSIAEDLFFSLIAYKLGYEFDFIEGEVLEKSPFTQLDFIRQRKRWYDGTWLVVCSDEIPLHCKVYAMVNLLSWSLTPFVVFNGVAESIFVLPRWQWFDLFSAFLTGSLMFIYCCGVLKSYTLYRRRGLAILCLQLIAFVFITPLNFIYQLIVVVWSLFSRKNDFYVVEKEMAKNKSSQISIV